MRLALIGFGVVGKALIELLESSRAELQDRYGIAPTLVAVTDSRGSAVAEHGLTAAELLAAKSQHGTVSAIAGHGLPRSTPVQVIADCAADVVIETSPSDLKRRDAAIEHLKAAFRHGAHAVSVNKAPLAVAMPALLELARYNRVQFRFSGTVGAGTPILAWAERCALGNRVTAVRAIINGTTNFILSRMTDHGETFDAALAEAVRLGYAETDPSNDIDGIDTAMKLVILANHVIGLRASFNDVHLQGIRGLGRDRIEAARKNASVVKLIASYRDGKLAVAPEEVPAQSPMNVAGGLNAVTLTCATGGDTTLIGRGAGGPETATAILRDLVDIWRTTH
ncbi:MAG: homoserine dehydrogenase [Phycisphaerales bacterium]